jgi:hypothetical protein
MPVNVIFSIYGHSLKALTQQFGLGSRNLSRRSNLGTLLSESRNLSLAIALGVFIIV